MERSTSKNLLLPFLMILIITGIVVAATGVFIVDSSESEAATFEEIHNFTSDEIRMKTSKATIYGTTYAFFLQAGGAASFAPESQQGITVGGLMRWAGILAIVVALIILLMIEFIHKNRVNQMNYRILLIISLFVLPVIVGLSTSTTVLETTKSVQSCGTCHVMEPFVNDLTNSESASLASRHAQNGWISEYQCYTCHTTYGAHGTFEGKRDGFRHWLLFVTRTWDEPISYSGSYPNMNCTACHGGTPAFRDVPSHLALSNKLRADEVSCTSCHGPAHPTPAEREQVTAPADDPLTNRSEELNSDQLTKLIEMIHEQSN